jgi:predicted RNase H-like HicB family nuclease
MISRISVCLEVGPQATAAFTPEYPGCWVYGRNEKSALQEVRIAVTEWVDWLKSYGESVPDIGDNTEVEVNEMLRVDYDPSESGKPEPLFWSEVGPITKEDIDKTLRLMKYSRDDLTAAITGITEDCFDWQPPVRLRTIRNCLIHIAHAEIWYITRLNIETPEELPENLFELLDYSRGIAVKCLQDLPERKMKGIFQPRKYRSPICNLWTARKVLRRLVDHERLHTRDIKKVLELKGVGRKVKERRSLS